jgi:hypothetical protein
VHVQHYPVHLFSNERARQAHARQGIQTLQTAPRHPAHWAQVWRLQLTHLITVSLMANENHAKCTSQQKRHPQGGRHPTTAVLGNISKAPNHLNAIQPAAFQGTRRGSRVSPFRLEEVLPPLAPVGTESQGPRHPPLPWGPQGLSCQSQRSLPRWSMVHGCRPQ